MLKENFKPCTITKLRKVFSTDSGLRLFGASYRFYSDLFLDTIRIDSHIQFEDKDNYFSFNITVLNRKTVDLYTLVNQGQDFKYDLIGDIPDMDIEDEPQLDTNIAHVEVKFHKDSGEDRGAHIEYKTFKTNGRSFTLFHVFEQSGEEMIDPFHEVFLLFSNKNKLNLFHAVGTNQKLTKQTTHLLLECFDSSIHGRMISGSIDGVLYANNMIDGFGWDCIFSYYPTHSDISFCLTKNGDLIISTDTGTLSIDYRKLSTVTYSDVQVIVNSDITRYRWEIYFKDKNKLSILVS